MPDVRRCRTPSWARKSPRRSCCGRATAARTRELREFCGERLAAFKVPRKIVFLSEIPKGATGKLQRIGLAEKLGLHGMKVAIFGAGAIGGFLGVELAQAGADVTFIARGPHLAAMQANGVTLRSGGETRRRSGRAARRCVGSGVQDYVVVTLKAHALPAAAPQIAAMMGPESALVTGINGIPYWYFYGLDGPYRDRRRCKRRSRRAGCGTSAAAPGDRLRRVSGGRGHRAGRHRAHLWRPLHVGEPDGSRSPRVEALSQAADRGRAEGAGAAAHSRRVMGEAMGQPGVQPALGADRVDARPDHRRAAAARVCAAA